MENLKNLLLLILFIWNIIVFFLYGLDKWKAIHERWRLSECLLIGTTLLFGGFGGFLGGRFFHHKTRKWYFWFGWILGLLINFIFIFFVLKKL